MALREYFNQKRRAIEELRPTAMWALDCYTRNAYVEVLELPLHFPCLTPHQVVSYVMEYGPIVSKHGIMGDLGVSFSGKWYRQMH
jgi:hypothetical protein